MTMTSPLPQNAHLANPSAVFHATWVKMAYLPADVPLASAKL
jgi:hypothetical protein